METTKICTCCNTEKSIKEFSIRTDTGKHRLQCIKCRLEYSKEHYERNKQKRLEQCKEYYENNKEAKRLWGFKHRKENKTHILARCKRYYQKNKDAISKKSKEYRDSPIGKAKHKEYMKKDFAKLSKRNSSQKRRALIRNGDVTTIQLKELVDRSKNCYWCNIKLNKNNIHLDHLMPLSKGGEHTLANLVVSCPTCNLQKNAKDPYQFAQERGRLF